MTSEGPKLMARAFSSLPADSLPTRVLGRAGLLMRHGDAPIARSWRGLLHQKIQTSLQHCQLTSVLLNSNCPEVLTCLQICVKMKIKIQKCTRGCPCQAARVGAACTLQLLATGTGSEGILGGHLGGFRRQKCCRGGSSSS